MFYQLIKEDVRHVLHTQDQYKEILDVATMIAHQMKFILHLDSVEDVHLVHLQIALKELASEIPQYVLIEKDFQMTTLDVFHASHTLELKTMDLTVQLIHATPTKL
jgi:hypothetical protein